LWPGERFGEKNRVRVFPTNAFNQILPERNRLGMRVVHSKDPHTALGPKQNDAFHLGPELAPVFASKVYGINVFVFFWRVLSEFDRAIGPFVEPFRMLLDVRM